MTTRYGNASEEGDSQVEGVMCKKGGGREKKRLFYTFQGALVMLMHVGRIKNYSLWLLSTMM